MCVRVRGLTVAQDVVIQRPLVRVAQNLCDAHEVAEERVGVRGVVLVWVQLQALHTKCPSNLAVGGALRVCEREARGGGARGL